MLRKFTSISLLSLAGTTAIAEPVDPRNSFDRAPYVSARAAGMSQAISTVANGMESAFYNPALIGGLFRKDKGPKLTHLYFPYIGGAYGESSSRLQKELTAGKDFTDASVAQELLRGFDGEHPYARLSFTPALIVSKLFVGYTSDTRAMSMPDPDQPDRLLIRARKSSGPMLGFSANDPKGEVHLGVSAALINRSDIEGSFTLPEVNGVPERKTAFSSVEQKYEGIPVTVGLQWNGKSMAHPAVSAVVRNAGSTPYENKNGDKRITDQEDVTVGFSLSPQLGSFGYFNLIVEGTQLSDHKTPAIEKFRSGMELTLGDRFGAEAGLALRAGYSIAGISYGLGLHAGILTVEAASFAEDIGPGDARVIERRNVINFGINVADY